MCTIILEQIQENVTKLNKREYFYNLQCRVIGPSWTNNFMDCSLIRPKDVQFFYLNYFIWYIKLLSFTYFFSFYLKPCNLVIFIFKIYIYTYMSFKKAGTPSLCIRSYVLVKWKYSGRLYLKIYMQSLRIFKMNSYD